MTNDRAQSKGNSERQRRLLSLDGLRGLIILLMALDHANYFVAQKHPPGEHWGGPFPDYNSALAFLTRLVTHPVAPGFFFLMGAGMVLFARSRRENGWNEPKISRHFLQRGSLLIGLQFLVVNRAWQIGSAPFPRIYLGVLYALGGCMILGGLLLRVRPRWQLLAALAFFVGTEVTHPGPGRWGIIFDRPLGLMFAYSGGSLDLWSNYPILPWMELVLFGMAFGHWLSRDSRTTYRKSLTLAAAFLVAFLVLRSLDGFGNIRPMHGRSWIDFLNTVKYPPSMTFTLMTMTVNLFLLWLLACGTGLGWHLLRPLAVLGRAPLFCYVIHLFIYAVMGNLLTPQGTSVLAMYSYWILGVFLLYPAAWWFGRFKRRQPLDSPVRYL